MSIAAIILAAGASRRLGQPKQLVFHHGETLLARTLRITQSAITSPVVAVLGASADQIRSAIDFGNAQIVENPHWQQGIASSIQAGLEFIEENESAAAPTEGVLILTCDQPHLTEEHLVNLQKEFLVQSDPQREAIIAASAYAGVVGTPAIFPRSLFGNLHALVGDEGARSLLRNPTCRILQIELPGGELDIDLPDDLQHLESSSAQQKI